MRVVYVAGPFRAVNQRGEPDMWRVQQNVMRAMEVARAVWHVGVAALCPHANSMFFTGAEPDSVWLAGAIELMRRCDAVIVVPGWEQSAGTIEEVRIAREIGLPVFVDLGDIEEWALR